MDPIVVAVLIALAAFVAVVALDSWARKRMGITRGGSRKDGTGAGVASAAGGASAGCDAGGATACGDGGGGACGAG